MSASKLDAVYRSILLTKFFTKGWGKPENLRRLFEFRKVVSNREECFKLVERDYPVTITKEQNVAEGKLLEGYFTSPLEKHLPGIVPEIAQKAHFQALLPTKWPDKDCKPVCLHLAGTGDHFYWRRRNLMVKPLLKEAGIGGIILENPFYGLRKPIDQIRSSLHNVSDIFVMGGCLILESLVLFHWCERNGLGPLGVTGLSMGGHMASLAATNWPKPLVLVPCLSWSTASAVFLQGVMAHSINWDLLEDQYLSDGEYREKLSKMVTIVDEAFLAGKKFARTYSQNMEKNVQTATQTKTSDNVGNNSNKNLDITYKENKNESENTEKVIDVTKTVLDSNKIVKNANRTELENQIENLNEELKKLLEEGKINQALYEKLISNKKFELDPQDIEDINKLTENKLKEMLLKCKVAELRNEETLLSETLTHTKESNDMTEQRSMGTSNITADNTNVPTLKAPEKNELIPEADKSKSWNITDFTSDIWANLPFFKPSGKKIDIGKIHWRDREALQFMRGIMDECTHLSNFSVPFDTSLIIAVCAQHDAYVPRDDVGTLEEIWPGAEVRYVDAGHVSAYLLHQSLFRSCIIEAFERSKKRWKDGKHID
ncbi:protein ABHD18 isoform X1 [Bombyx mandarina]|uniref:Protein ABHD18 isoform X1 n=1 Tax=Bombyx mandarina TaxID=7092 RepID=A0A6J2K0B9_BOMMA|nr:protein ABHD18 isoform X1 [Bombyx mandarina]